MDISLILLLPAMLFMGYYAGYTWRTVGAPEPHADFAVQVSNVPERCFQDTGKFT
jgi:hypothetical protein